MATSSELNRVKYIAEDFATYRSEADAFFQANYPEDFNNLIATDIGNALMDQLAFAMQSLSFMVNRRASELFLDTARLNKSIVKLARMLGYSISSATPAQATQTITFPNAPYTTDTPIPSGFQFQGPGDTIYEYRGVTSAILPAGQTSLTIPIKEGQSKRLSFISDGSENQQFQIFGIPSGQFLYQDGLQVLVDGVPWTRVDLLKFEASNIFEILFVDSPPKLKFGDRIVGNIPPTSSEIVLIFAYGKGLVGAIGSNQITGPVTPLVINGVTIDMSITNDVATVGSDPEDIRHVKSFASSFFRTQNAAVVKTDYDTIAQLRSGVALADAQIMRGIDNDISIQTYLAEIAYGEILVASAVSGMSNSSVSGISGVGVSGIDALGISGVSGLYVGGADSLGVSGVSYLGVAAPGGAPASGSLTFTAVGNNNDVFYINGIAFTAVPSGAGAQQYNIGATPAATAANAVIAINSSTDSLVTQHVTALASGASAMLTSKNMDVFGNAVTISTDDPSRITVSGARLTGGTPSVSSSVSGMSYLGVSGADALFVGGQGGLSVSGISGVAVSGISGIGISGIDLISANGTSGLHDITTGVSGLTAYLSQSFSDTSKANNVQVVVLGVDINNKYIAPPTAVLQDVQATVQNLADAVVTVVAVDGSSKIVPVDIEIELGISQTAIEADVLNEATQALVQSITPYGLLVRRAAGVSLYKSDIQDAIRAATITGDVVFMNVKITSPLNLLDVGGNLIISAQQIIQNNIVTVKVVKRFIGGK